MPPGLAAEVTVTAAERLGVDAAIIFADILLIIEMADSSLRFDRRVKARLYAEMGISEYWVADLNAVCVFCYSDRDDKSYRVVRQFQKEESVAPELLPEDRIPVASLLP